MVRVDRKDTMVDVLQSITLILLAVGGILNALSAKKNAEAIRLLSERLDARSDR